MPNVRARAHRAVGEGVSGRPSTHALERVDLDRVVVTGGGDLTDGVEGGMAHAQPALVLAHTRRFPVLALASHLTQIPDAHEAIEAGRREEMRVLRMEGEAADFLLRERVVLGGGGGRGGAGIEAAEEAVEAGEVDDVGGEGVDFDAGKGFVGGRVGGAVDFGGGGGGEVEEADGRVIGAGVEVGGVEGGELEGGDGAGVQVKGGDGGSEEVVVVFEVGVGGFGLDG